MLVEKCSNCGYHLTFGEAVEILSRKKGSPHEALGINAFLNTTNVICPNCGLIGCWVSGEDEKITMRV